MTKIEIECPHCGSFGSVPREKAQTRLLCPKCHRAFHLNAAGHAIPGDPPHEHHATTPHQNGPAHAVAVAPRADPAAAATGGTPWRLPLLLVALAALVALLAYGLRKAPSPIDGDEGVIHLALAVATAMAENRPEVLRQLALPGTADDAARLLDRARPRLDVLRQDSPNQSLKVSILSVNLSPGDGKAQVVCTFAPDHGTDRNAEIAAAAGLGAGVRPPATMTLSWAKGPDGTWRLDSTQTAAAGLP